MPQDLLEVKNDQSLWAVDHAPRKSGFNWWVLLWGPFWYFYKGMWGRGVMFMGIAFAVALVTFYLMGLPGYLVWIFAAAKANEDYYIFWRQRQQAMGNL
jgi:hypothetical protein